MSSIWARIASSAQPWGASLAAATTSDTNSCRLPSGSCPTAPRASVRVSANVADRAAVAAEGIREAFVLAFYLEENAYRQYMASHLGEPYGLSDKEIALMAKNLWKPNLVKKTWDYHYSKLMQASA